MNSGQKIIFFFLLIIPFIGFCQNPVEVNQRVDYFSLPEPDWVEVKKSDSLQPGNRVSVPVRVDLNLQNSGKWTKDQNGYRRWNLTIKASNATLALAALLDTFSLSDGAVLSVFIDNNDFPTSRYIGTEGKIEKKLLGFFSSNKIRLELIEPPKSDVKSVIHIFRMDIGYKPVFEKVESDVTRGNSETLGFGASETCHTNIICPEGDIIQKEKNGIRLDCTGCSSSCRYLPLGNIQRPSSFKHPR
jgi:hypothetical protein